MAGEEKNWLENLQAEIEHADVSSDVNCEPRHMVERGDEVIGVMTDYEKKFYIYIQGISEEIEDLAEKVDSGEVNHMSDPRLSRFSELVARYMLLEDILMHSVTARLSLWLKTSTGLRRGWKIIARNESVPSEQIRRSVVMSKPIKGWQ